MCFLYNGNASGIDEVDGKALFNMAKESKITNDPNDQFVLGICYEFGIGVEQNYNKSFEEYQKAANQWFGWGLDSSCDTTEYSALINQQLTFLLYNIDYNVCYAV